MNEEKKEQSAVEVDKPKAVKRAVKKTALVKGKKGVKRTVKTKGKQKGKAKTSVKRAIVKVKRTPRKKVDPLIGTSHPFTKAVVKAANYYYWRQMISAFSLWIPILLKKWVDSCDFKCRTARTCFCNIVASEYRQLAGYELKSDNRNRLILVVGKKDS